MGNRDKIILKTSKNTNPDVIVERITIDLNKDMEKKLKDLNKDVEKKLNKKDKIIVKLQKELKKSIENSINSESQETLKNRAAEIISTASEINNSFKKLNTIEEKQEFINQMDSELGIGKLLTDSFPDLLNADSNDTPVPTANDLPTSDIIKNLPIRVLEQVFENLSAEYGLTNLVTTQTVANGIKDIFYKDFSDVDNKSGFSDVTLNDFNQGLSITYKETQRVDTEIHKGYDILDSILNDVTLTVGLFISLINNYVYAVARPFMKKMHQRFVTFLDSNETIAYDKVIQLTAADSKGTAKEILNELLSLQTTSRENLVMKPAGATRPLPYKMIPKKMVLIMNSKYATNYKYDVTSSVFNLNEVKIPVAEIVVLDFDKLSKYSENIVANRVLPNYDCLLIEKGLYNEMIHYDATKVVNTPKLKTVFNRYMRLGNYRLKNKLAIAFKRK